MVAIPLYYILSFYTKIMQRRLHGVLVKFRLKLAIKSGKSDPENACDILIVSIRKLIPKGVCFLEKIDLSPTKAVRREKGQFSSIC